MGSTIRRQPVSFKIPDSPDYKYLNLTTFTGLHQTDNPFTAQTNSASDTLNVYVDEQNALTTRPRVANKVDFGKIDGVVVGSYCEGDRWYVKIKKDAIIYVLTHDDYKLYPKEGTSLREGDFAVIIYNGNEIVLDGNQIFVRTGEEELSPANEWKDLPIPLVRTAKTKTNTEGVVYEARNVLTSQYREAYGVWSTETVAQGDSLVSRSVFSTDHIADEYYHRNGDLYKNGYVKWIHSGNGSAALFDDALCVSLWDKYLYVNVLKDTSVETNIIELTNRYMTIANFTQARTTHRFAFVDDTNAMVVFYERNGEWLIGNTTLPETGTIKKLMFSPSGNYVLCSYFGSKKIYVYKPTIENGEVMLYLTHTIEITDDEFTDFSIDDYDVVYVTAYSSPTYKLHTIDLNDEEPTLNEVATYDTWYTGLFYNIIAVRNGTRLYLDEYNAYIDLRAPEKINNMTHENISFIREVSYNDDMTVANYKGVPMFRGRLQSDSENTYVPYDNTEVTVHTTKDTVMSADRRYVLMGAKPGSGANYQIYYQNFNGAEYSYEILYDAGSTTTQLKMDNYVVFDNIFWYYSTNSNIVRWSSGDNPLYIPENNYDEVGDYAPLVNALIVSENTLGLFKKDKTYTATPGVVNERYTYLFAELTNDYGCYSPHGAVVSPLNNIPIVVGLNEISGLYSSENISKVNRYYSSLSLNIDKQYRKTDDKNKRYFVPEEIWASNIKYWSVFACNSDFGSRWLIFDDRTSDWFYWEVPAKVDNLWSDGDKLYFLSKKDKKIRVFETSDIVHPQNPELTEYYDLNRKLIKWHWRSQILPLGTINYYKKLVDTTFIVADTDANDSYALNYTFRAYRKNISESDLNTIKNEIQYVQSVTKKTLISRFNFLQFELSHTEDDDQLNNNKLRLIGMALKYVLLGGIMQ